MEPHYPKMTRERVALAEEIHRARCWRPACDIWTMEDLLEAINRLEQ